MALTSKTLQGIYNGISQQPAVMRKETMGEMQENAVGTLVDGLTKRPPTKFLATLTSTATSGAFVKGIDRDIYERYIMIITGDDTDPLEVYDTEGTKYTVRYGLLSSTTGVYTSSPQIKGYLTDELLTRGTWLFANQGDIVGGYDDQILQNNAAGNGTAYQAVNGLVPGETLNISFGCKENTVGISCQVHIKDSSGNILYDSGAIVTTSSIQTFTDTIVAPKDGYVLWSMVNLSSTTGHKVNFYSPSLTYDTEPLTKTEKFRATTVADHTFIVNITRTTMKQRYFPSAGGPMGTVQNFAGLPVSPTIYDVWQVQGDDSNSFTDYYVMWNGSAWVESVKTGTDPYRLDPYTMPHKLVRTGPSEFTFAPVQDWTGYQAGSIETNPSPSFLNNRISNIFFYNNRLGVLSEDHVVLSGVGAYYTFYRTSVLDLLDSDLIDISAASNTVQTLRSVAVFDKALLVFGDTEQFAIGSSGEGLSPNTVSATPTTAFPIKGSTDPVTLGANVFFASPSTNYLQIREYFVQPDSLTNDAADITAHVPRYIPNGVTKLEGMNGIDWLFALSDADPTAIYTYKFFWAGDEKLQSAWSKWVFSGNVLGMTAIDSQLFIVIEREGFIGLEAIEMDYQADDFDTGFVVHLDAYNTWEGGVYDAPNDRTYFVSAHPYDGEDDIVVVDSTTGLQLTIYSMVSPGTGVTTGVYVNGDYEGVTCYLGKPYTMTYRLSEWFMRNADGVSQVDGRLQMRAMTVHFEDTGYFRVEVTPYQRDTLTQPLVAAMTGVYVDVTTLGSASIMSGREKFLVMAKTKNTTIDIINDSYLPSKIQTVEYEGFHHKRARMT